MRCPYLTPLSQSFAEPTALFRRPCAVRRSFQALLSVYRNFVLLKFNIVPSASKEDFREPQAAGIPLGTRPARSYEHAQLIPQRVPPECRAAIGKCPKDRVAYFMLVACPRGVPASLPKKPSIPFIRMQFYYLRRGQRRIRLANPFGNACDCSPSPPFIARPRASGTAPAASDPRLPGAAASRRAQRPRAAGSWRMREHRAASTTHALFPAALR